VYRYTHQLFYQDNAIYFLLFDLSRSKQDNLAETEHWILDIVSRMRIAPQSKPNYRIYLIGTHCDRVSPQIAKKKYSFVVSSVKQSHPSLCLCSSSSSSSPFIISVPKKIGIDNLFDVSSFQEREGEGQSRSTSISATERESQREGANTSLSRVQ
jgi:hypothetical protein